MGLVLPIVILLQAIKDMTKILYQEKFRRDLKTLLGFLDVQF